MEVRRRIVLLVSAASLVASVACAADHATAPRVDTRIVVHAILDPNRTEQVVLVEQTRPSREGVVGAPDSINPIVGSGGIPVSGATVTITGPDGTFTAVEDGADATRASSPGLYRLHSLTVRGRSVMPRFTAAPDTGHRRFVVETDTLTSAVLPAVGEHAGYLLTHTSADGNVMQQFQRTLERTLLVPCTASGSGNAAWAFSFSRSDMLVGATERFVVAAVDTNVFRYFVSGFDTFGDETKGNTLKGGVGLFGSMALLAAWRVELVSTANGSCSF